MERLGAEGQVEEAQELMRTVEHLEKERERERLRLTGGGPKVQASSADVYVLLSAYVLSKYRCWQDLN